MPSVDLVEELIEELTRNKLAELDRGIQAIRTLTTGGTSTSTAQIQQLQTALITETTARQATDQTLQANMDTVETALLALTTIDNVTIGRNGSGQLYAIGAGSAPDPPDTIAYLTDDDGVYITDPDGSYLYEAA